MIHCGPRTRATATTIASLLIASPVLLAGCVSSSNPTAGTAEACKSQTPGVTASSVKIGFIYPDTGPAAVASAFQAARSGVEARIGLQNDHGGVLGRKIDLVWADDQSDAQVFSLVAHNLVDTQKVFGLTTTSIALDQSAGWLADQDVPVTGAATSATWSNYPNLFHSGNLFNTGGATVYGDFVKAQGGTKALVVVDPTVATSQSLAAQFAPSLQSRGIQVVGEVTYTQGITSAARVADQLNKTGADTLVGAAQATPFIDIYSQAKALGVKLKVALNSTGYSVGELDERGADMAGISIMSSLAPLGSPAVEAYGNTMNTYAPEVANPEDELAVAGYVVADEMVEGLQLAGPCPTRQAFIQRLRKVTDYTANGLIPPVDLSHPKQPTLCQTFVTVDKTGHSFVPVAPPAALNHAGYWCGEPLQ